MKILIIQLARLGDIYQSWPSIRALARKHPEARIDILTRKKFSGACIGCGGINQVFEVDSHKLLGPLVSADPDIKAAFAETSQFVDQLTVERYDWIINMSFSPASSYFTHLLTHPETKVSGYTRTEDGYLAIPDAMSAYFYGQVGPGRSNRFHLVEIFSSMVEMDLVSSDWAPPQNLVPNRFRKGIVIHVGASEKHKSLTAQKWAAIINQISKVTTQEIVLIGASGESSLSETITNSTSSNGVRDLVGKTTLVQVFEILNNAALLIGCDSAPIHMASLVQTPVLNISIGNLNFWETGPRSERAYILRGKTEEDFASDTVASFVEQILSGKSPKDLIKGVQGVPSYQASTSEEEDFRWDFIRAIYQGEAFPAAIGENFILAAKNLDEVNNLIIEKLQYLKGGGDIKKVSGILDRSEEIVDAIGKICPDIRPLVSWYQTEKLRIGPGNFSDILDKTLAINRLLNQVLSCYLPQEQEVESEL